MAFLAAFVQRASVSKKNLRGAASTGRSKAGLALSYLLACLAAVLISQTMASTPASSQTPSEAEITAAFIVNFARFTEWPPNSFADASTSLTVGVLGAEDVRAALEKFAGGKELNGRKVIIRQVSMAADARTCQVVFILVAKENIVVEVLKAARETSTLTIGQSEDILSRGAMIRLFVENSKMRFDVNLTAISSAKIHLSSRLLALARNIVSLPQQGGI